ncbi:hypothetical protein DENSPDRAFT_840639 [Dentipellis sp. KUC8613]|nr:hypothetical protein DENSPDRAFT_840639 [Dentipellis sp. KUC8613]
MSITSHPQYMQASGKLTLLLGSSRMEGANMSRTHGMVPRPEALLKSWEGNTPRAAFF